MADLYRHQEGLFRRRGHQDRPRLRAGQFGRDPAARGRRCQCEHRQRPGRSDPRNRQGRAARDRAHRDAAAALYVAGEARHQEHEGAQGQGRFRRRREGHHAHLLRAHAGAERRRSEGRRPHLCGRNLGPPRRAAVGRR